VPGRAGYVTTGLLGARLASIRHARGLLSRAAVLARFRSQTDASVVVVTHLFSDPAVVEAGRKAFKASLIARVCGRLSDQADAFEDGLAAAVAALPRDELIEKAARAICDQGINTLNGRAATWEQHADGFRGMAESALVAIGLIPEHVTATEER
jgi:hypothetical protein